MIFVASYRDGIVATSVPLWKTTGVSSNIILMLCYFYVVSVVLQNNIHGSVHLTPERSGGPSCTLVLFTVSLLCPAVSTLVL
jgi:hypothetical protein